MDWFSEALPFINAALAMIVSICWVIFRESLDLGMLGGQEKDDKMQGNCGTAAKRSANILCE